jgi:hypothetical protein
MSFQFGGGKIEVTPSINKYGQCYHTKYVGCPPCIHDAYADGYLDGYTDAEKHYRNKCVLCGIGGISSSWLCMPCKEENPHWIGE